MFRLFVARLCRFPPCWLFRWVWVLVNLYGFYILFLFGGAAGAVTATRLNVLGEQCVLRDRVFSENACNHSTRFQRSFAPDQRRETPGS